ncbi:MAG TPA: RHS repeat-associated core domain-containing protein, partial [Longimicrobium sp.]|nr:RHS repeat-associated core domain-containing protein [Longimicrobium sp.]
DYDMGTYDGLREPPCKALPPVNGGDHEQVGGGPDSQQDTVPRPTHYVCMVVEWPAAYLWMSHLSRENTPAGPRSWTGSLIQNKRDLTGLLYMRNRYYDPKTGRFTQEDPIGLAGGLNAYGFADGDPVTYSDPYGLAPCPPDCSLNSLWENVVTVVRRLRDEPEQRKLGDDLAPGIFTSLASGTLHGPSGVARGNPLSGVAPGNPLNGTRYTGKVRQQMRPRSVAREVELSGGRKQTVREYKPDNHGFPLQVDNMARFGTTKAFKGGDGVERTLVEVRGHYQGKNGTFEWIIEPDRTVNHRYFRADP